MNNFWLEKKQEKENLQALTDAGYQIFVQSDWIENGFGTTITATANTINSNCLNCEIVARIDKDGIARNANNTMITHSPGMTLKIGDIIQNFQYAGNILDQYHVERIEAEGWALDI